MSTATPDRMCSGRIMRSLPTRVSLAVLAVVSSAGEGCGSGGGSTADGAPATGDGSSIDPDGAAAGPDAALGALDASATGLDASTVPLLATGTISILETKSYESGSIAGPVTSIWFIDETTRTVAPVAGFESSVNGCAVRVYDVADGDTEPTLADEGEITVAGTGNGAFTCTYSAATDPAGQYVCQS